MERGRGQRTGRSPLAHGILRSPIRTGRYQPYEELVATAASSVGLSLTSPMISRPVTGDRTWPEVASVAGTLHAAGVPLGVVTNCSEELGRLAASRIPVPFSSSSPPTRGLHKPEPQPISFGARRTGRRCRALSVRGGVRLRPVRHRARRVAPWWHDRIGMTAPPDAPAPIARHPTLAPLLVHALSRSRKDAHE